MATCVVQYPLDDGMSLQSLAVRIFSANGILMKQFIMPEFDPATDIEIATYGERLLICVGEHVFVCQQKFKANGRGNSNSMEPLYFREILHLDGEKDLMMTKTEAFQPKMRVFWGGMHMILLRKLNFWAHDL